MVKNAIKATCFSGRGNRDKYLLTVPMRRSILSPKNIGNPIAAFVEFTSKENGHRLSQKTRYQRRC